MHASRFKENASGMFATIQALIEQHKNFVRNPLFNTHISEAI